MATIKAGKGSYITVDNMLLSGTRASDASLRMGSDELEASTIGQNWKEFLQGQAEATLDVSGVWDAGTAADALDAKLNGMVNAGGTKLWEFVPGGSTTNEPIYNGNAICTAYEISAPVAGVVGFTSSFRVSGSVTRSTLA